MLLNDQLWRWVEPAGLMGGQVQLRKTRRDYDRGKPHRNVEAIGDIGDRDAGHPTR